MKVIARFGSAAVIERTDGRSECRDRTPSIHQLRFEPAQP
jgi:hypothetical protein